MLIFHAYIFGKKCLAPTKLTELLRLCRCHHHHHRHRRRRRRRRRRRHHCYYVIELQSCRFHSQVHKKY